MTEKVFELSHAFLGGPEGLSRAAGSLCDLLLSRGMTISCAESATCGLVAKLLTDRSGSSAWYWGGVESYANSAKVSLLGVSESLLSDPSRGPVTAECAICMADGMRRVSGTTVALSVTGIAGPGGAEEGKPVGTVYLGFSSSFRESQAVRVLVHASDRAQCREAFAWAVLELASTYIQGLSIIDKASTWH